MIDIKNEIKNRSLQKIQPHTNYKACVFDFGQPYNKDKVSILDFELNKHNVSHCIFENCSFRTPAFFESLDFSEFHQCNFVELTINHSCAGEEVHFYNGYIETLKIVEHITYVHVLDSVAEKDPLFSSVNVKNVCVENIPRPIPTPLYHFPQMQTLKIQNSAWIADYILNAKTKFLAFCVERNRPFPPSGQIIDISKFKKLQLVDVSNNRIQRLPAVMGSLSELRELNAGVNLLKEIPPQIGNLTNLHTLSLYNNQIFELTQQIGKLCCLQNLNLRYNTLENLPREIGQLQQLTFLDISENQIVTLPHEIGDLINLRTFYARENGLTTLPDSMENWQNVTHIDLYHNKIEELPWQICHLSNLSTLNLEGNPISDMPYEIDHLCNLRYLNLVNTNVDERKVQQLRKQLPDCDVFC
ncbi:leucine-rich repeat domain-containing protein [Candidatus Uabimicrobium amorphum]|uniref:Disease resistance R13L4/SHOC-2-like LRR domain-containing protein n=1 Tax=Uabimicrobium amorphum TaxID=2596890 RepID=A0A5S9IM43_UABAM|nr:leucine-rich repeat domain-containing protein [Candidatus Uabimicrobium amorphum]BBM83570.1 hypothetical protein UABAM_01923 [Candidatus Uabimicrobium amorphum]